MKTFKEKLRQLRDQLESRMNTLKVQIENLQAKVSFAGKETKIKIHNKIKQ